MRRTLLTLGMVLLVVGTACGNDGTSSENGENGENGESGSFRAASYNAGLAVGFVDNAAERAPVVADALGELDVELLVVQEVWQSEDVEAVEAATSEALPNQIFLDPSPDPDPGPPSCTLPDLDPLQQCIEQNCSDVSDDDLVDCVLANCGSQFGALSGDCQSCLGANIGLPIDTVIDNCTSSSARFAYEGSFGIGLLTSAEILDQDSTVFESELNRRAVIYALLDTAQLGEVHVFTTHLSAVFDDIPHPGGRTWEEEQADQVTALLDFIGDKADDGKPVLVMGDLNFGPAGDAYRAEIVENYDALVEGGGFANPYVESAAATCTFCDDNPLIGAGGPGGVLIDHVLVADFDGEVTAERILDEVVEINVEGETVETALSDHYGVLVSLTPPS